MDNPEVTESQLVGDIKHSLALFALKDLESQDEIAEGISVITQLGKEFRHLHVELQSQLGKEYEGKFLHYTDTDAKINKYLRDAMIKKRELKTTSQTHDKEDEKYRICVEADILQTKVDRVNNEVDFYVVKDNQIDKYVSKMEHFIDEFYSLIGKLKVSRLDDKTVKDLEEKIILAISEIEQDVKCARLLKRKYEEVQLSLTRAKTVESEQLKSITGAENLKAEISYRFKTISKRFEADLDNLGDYQILEIHQDRKNVDLEFSSVMEKISDLSSLVSTGGCKVEQLFKQASKTRDRLSLKREKFFAKLEDVVIQRDITADKMKSASEVTIELEKFCGYDSKKDIFTFKTEFQRHVEPKYQKKHLADCLKHNYLTGPALVLVEKEDNYEKIWERLLSSYGNTRLLLHNKLSTLENLSLSNVKGDKVCVKLASLINTMQDLSTLAAEHNIEGQLYEGGGPEKVLFLIGEGRHRKFRSQNLGPTYTKKQEWQKLVEFLEADLNLRQTLSLDQKTAEQLGFSTHKEGPPRIKNGSHNVTSQSLQCHICDQVGHTVVTTAKGRKILPYYVCEIFLKMTHDERFAKLVSKNLCTVCLFPGAVKNAQHKCFYTNFCCPSHGKQDKIHFLLCGKHKNDPKNLEMSEKFKDRFVKNCPVDLPDYVFLIRQYFDANQSHYMFK